MGIRHLLIPVVNEFLITSGSPMRAMIRAAAGWAGLDVDAKTGFRRQVYGRRQPPIHCH
jgi:hypothetical protein